MGISIRWQLTNPYLYNYIELELVPLTITNIIEHTIDSVDATADRNDVPIITGVLIPIILLIIIIIIASVIKYWTYRHYQVTGTEDIYWFVCALLVCYIIANYYNINMIN